MPKLLSLNLVQPSFVPYILASFTISSDVIKRGSFFRKSGDWQAFFANRADFLSVYHTAKSFVENIVLRFRHNFQINNPVVRLIAVNVMHNLFWEGSKFPPKVLFHNKSVFSNPHTIVENVDVPSSNNGSFSPCVPTYLFQCIAVLFQPLVVQATQVLSVVAAVTGVNRAVFHKLIIQAQALIVYPGGGYHS